MSIYDREASECYCEWTYRCSNCENGGPGNGAPAYTPPTMAEQLHAANARIAALERELSRVRESKRCGGRLFIDVPCACEATQLAFHGQDCKHAAREGRS